MNELLLQLAVTAPVLLFSMTCHEVSHGYMAYRLGDPTAKNLKRLSLNPLQHLDRLGTLMLAVTFLFSNGAMLFGWAKPVPVNPGYFKSQQYGMMWVGMAGPAANLVLAALAALVLHILYLYPADVGELLINSIFRIFQLNVILMVFNLIPVPPLDGSRIAGALMPPKTYAKWVQLDRYGMLFVLVLLMVLINTGGLSVILRPIYRVFLPGF
ncbi:MAG: site-2 protease family protein [Thermoleophilia bacterium]|nr:site-2 protease family protein [Thermoleophilia bacterium]